MKRLLKGCRWGYFTAYAPSGTTVTPQYGGNISQVVWKVKGREKQAYTLKYDSENRMTEAIYSDIGNSGTITGNRYDEKLTYDILALSFKKD